MKEEKRIEEQNLVFFNEYKTSSYAGNLRKGYTKFWKSFLAKKIIYKTVVKIEKL